MLTYIKEFALVDGGQSLLQKFIITIIKHKELLLVKTIK